ncbi:hypothetical protein [Marinoscillum furvescens]|uniref:Uncharacterized protein n=1 Tax=Marinoscillum furvescens DSM 4134 TaxID=1122208 RepID=A0A3D9LH00_MARFU|nr:hypothetical protein [Marinoscillum furvescens]REE05744.1 hypothetical protein C7460_101263 [Marinoscillum furvescens DSM 4134]
MSQPDEIKLAKGSLSLIQKDLKLNESCDLEGVENPFKVLRQFLKKRVQYLLDHDFGHLLNAMYRIDIPEPKLRRILDQADPECLADEISEAIIERERAKMVTRLRYSSR